MFLFCKSKILEDSGSSRPPPLDSSLKARFKAFWDIFFENVYATLASQVTDFAQKGDLACVCVLRSSSFQNQGPKHQSTSCESTSQMCLNEIFCRFASFSLHLNSDAAKS